MVLYLLRTDRTPDGTFGLLRTRNLELHTCEDDWLENVKGKSCIPDRVYTIRRTIFMKHGYETFEVTGVPNRSRILIHPGNTEEDTQGCILVGMRRGTVVVPVDEDTGAQNVEKQAVVASQEAFRRLMRVLEGVDTATLEIAWAQGVAPH